ncbi:DUF4369 domain-containing protein [Dyadobacter sp. CY343]|uniref:DUF4369 domain-containing protein n=1 Tax=Dyadobacter sp. CY343 TaxID=2907299 RepID=UPI0038D4F364
MPYKVSTIICLLISLQAHAQVRPYTVRGELLSTRATKAYLIYADPGTGQKTMDSCVVKDGKFLFKGTVNIPARAFVRSHPDQGSIDLYLEPGQIKIYSPDSLSSAIIEGGNVNIVTSMY